MNKRQTERNAAIVADRDSGMTYAQIAEKYSRSVTTMRHIVEQEKRRIRRARSFAAQKAATPPPASKTNELETTTKDA